MAFIREKTIKGKRYRYLQHNVRRGKKVKSIMTYLGAVGIGALNAVDASVVGAAFAKSVVRDVMGKDKPRYYHNPVYGTDKRDNANQAAFERELFDKDRDKFNAHAQYDAGRHKRGKGAAKQAKADNMSRADKREAVVAREAATRKFEADGKAMREFSEQLKAGERDNAESKSAPNKDAPASSDGVK